MMRPLALILALAAAAGPAAAQLNTQLLYDQQAQQQAAAEAARQRDIAITNELSRLQSQIQTNQALSDVAALRVPPAPLPPANGRHPVRIDASKLAQIPDAVLADSNARVVAASKNRR